MTDRFPNAQAAVMLLIRLLVGLVVFIPEGIQKLLFPEILGAARFASVGIPWPEVVAPVVGVIEIVCGILIVLGFKTRLAAIPLAIIMIVSIISTKIPILLGQDFWLFHVPTMARYGFWSMMHEARNDLCVLLAALCLFINGGGKWSVDGAEK